MVAPALYLNVARNKWQRTIRLARPPPVGATAVCVTLRRRPFSRAKFRSVFLEISAEVEGHAYLISHRTARPPQGKAGLWCWATVLRNWGYI